MKIIDVSKHNGKINWQQVAAAGVTDVIIRLSLGYGAIDPTAADNAHDAAAAGIRVGYYHFAYPDTKQGGTVEKDATAEAQFFVQQFESVGLPVPRILALDLETWQEPRNGVEKKDSPLASADYYKWVSVFLLEVLNKTGIVPLVYSNAPYLNSKLPKGHKLGLFPLWLANYSQTAPPLPAGWDRYFMHQYTAKGSVQGITGDVDMNRLFISTVQLP